jgi:hypothetical protein
MRMLVRTELLRETVGAYTVWIYEVYTLENLIGVLWDRTEKTVHVVGREGFSPSVSRLRLKNPR